MFITLFGRWLINSSKMPAGHFSLLVIVAGPFLDKPSSYPETFWEVFLSLRNVGQQTWHMSVYFHPLQTWIALCVSYSFLAFLLNQNVESLSTKLCSVDKSILFPQHFFSQAGESVAFGSVPLSSCWRVIPLENLVRLCESSGPYTLRDSGS